jgi:hypothetical protein
VALEGALGGKVELLVLLKTSSWFVSILAEANEFLRETSSCVVAVADAVA